ncbi:MAG: hypothetical protein AAF281_07720 [Pseudomonadota bacterium]
MIGRALTAVARRGRLALVAGLVAGLLLPGLAAAMRPWLPELVGVLLFLTAFRIGPRAALGSLGDLRATFGLALLFQGVLPLVVLAALTGLDLVHWPLALSLLLVLAAPSITGAPNFAIMLGHDPAPALRLVILGTALFPLTVLPILALAPILGSPGEVALAASRLLVVIGLAVTLGFGLRHGIAPTLSGERQRQLDGLAAIMLAVLVVGLMSALGPALRETPGRLALWALAAFAVNFGLQIVWALIGGRDRPGAVGVSIVAGNRNVALFLVALPPEVTDPLLIFIGCYQVPMYLTPILLRRFYPPGAVTRP